MGQLRQIWLFFPHFFFLALRKVKAREYDQRDFCKESVSGERALLGSASTSAGIAGRRNNEAVVGEVLERKL